MFAFLALNLTTATVYAGAGDSGGGGSVVRCGKNSGWLLLDSANRTPKMLPSAQVVPAKSSNATKLSPFEIKKTAAYGSALKLLSRWKSGSPDFIEMIENAIHKLPYYITSSSFVLSKQYTIGKSLKAICPNLEIQTAILFLPGYGSIISAPFWDSADIETQAGLLIHEALRQIQMAYAFGTKNGDLEAITAQIISGNAHELPQLQDSPRIDGMLRRHLQAKKRVRERADANAKNSVACPTCFQQAGPLAHVLSLENEFQAMVMNNQQSHFLSPSELDSLWQKLVREKRLKAE